MLIERPKSITTQVSDLLAERIRSQEYAPGSRLPSESDLALQLGVSRATVRSALARLATQGLVLRKQGNGTYVNAHLESFPSSAGGLWNFLRLIEFSGREPSIRVLSRAVRPALESEIESLALQESDPVFFLQRVFFADDIPAVLAGNAIPVSSLRQPPEECDGQLPIDEFIVRYCNAKIAYDIFDICAILPDAETQDVLQLQADQPILQLRQVFYDGQNEPLLCGSSAYNEKLLGLRLVQSWS
ncbi:MAG TPA: GntR family transcriptional regulator [Anaerolineae bacterium]|nr:GntR family transcriptional regulator [Anaerolineae bacterium]